MRSNRGEVFGTSARVPALIGRRDEGSIPHIGRRGAVKTHGAGWEPLDPFLESQAGWRAAARPGVTGVTRDMAMTTRPPRDTADRTRGFQRLADVSNGQTLTK
jgi:hypothetical protein